MNHVGAAVRCIWFTLFQFPETNQILSRIWWSRGETRGDGWGRLFVTVIDRVVAGAIGLFVGHDDDHGGGVRHYRTSRVAQAEERDWLARQR